METWQSSEGGGDLTTERTLCLEKRERGDRKDGKMYDTTNPIDSVWNQDLLRGVRGSNVLQVFEQDDQILKFSFQRINLALSFVSL